MRKIPILASFIMLCLASHAITRVDSVASPDRNLVVYIKTDENGISYRVTYKSKETVAWSQLGLVFADRSVPGKNVYISNTVHKSVNQTIPWVFGENAQISNRYNELIAAFADGKKEGFRVEVRVFNNNLAFRYILSPVNGASNILVRENTNFNLTRNYNGYRHNGESVIVPMPINILKPSSDLPLVLASPLLYMCINEAANTNYTKVNIGKTPTENGLALKFIKDSVIVKDLFSTPWRTISFSETAIGLCSYSDLLYKLCDAPAQPVDLKNFVPGKLMRDMTLTTEGAKACIDFAASNNFQYVMYDAGWYGKGYNDQFSLTANPRSVVKEIDMPEVIRYGNEKKIGLILYVNYVGLRKFSMDSSFTLYRNWGVKGLKFGFVDGLTQDGISWLMGAVQKAQEYGFIVDVHDNYKPTGLSRTYPAWLTQEGVRGNENNPDATHNTTLPFTRLLSGAADYTFCYRNQNDSFNNALLSKKLQVSKGQQLALTVIFFSPLQSVLWYGKPADYRIPVETEFFSYVPTVWDKTVPIEGQIGEYITIARRKDGVWYVGSIAGNKLYQRKLKLDFLDRNRVYKATIFSDDGNGGIRKTEKEVSSRTVLTDMIAAKGGVAMRIRAK